MVSNRRGGVRVLVTGLAGLALGVGVARGQEGAAEGPWFVVSEIRASYPLEEERQASHPMLPPLDEVLRSTSVTLAVTSEGYTAPAEGSDTVVLRLSEIAEGPVSKFSATALEAISIALRKELNARRIGGVIVSPSTADIEPGTLADLREGGTGLLFDVWTARVSRVRSISTYNDETLWSKLPASWGLNTPAEWSKPEGEERIDRADPVSTRVRERSPVRAGDPERDVIRTDLMERYVHGLTRHPGRRVDIAVGQGERVDDNPTAVVDYLITQGRPWYVIAQVSNTGTKQTNEWREKIQFVHNQLTGRDDILDVQYITAGFDSAHALSGSYEAPLPGLEDDFRFRVFANWNQYTASDVGLQNTQFEGDGWLAGGEIIANVYQSGTFFVDVFAGAKWQSVSVDNTTAGVRGEEDFFIPRAGISAQHSSMTHRSAGTIAVEGNLADAAGTSSSLDALGRINADDEWIVVLFDGSYSRFLDPLFFGDEWNDPQSPRSTLGHELYTGLRGQVSMDARLVPNAEQVVGGLYTVRGYPESVIAADTVVIGTVEYRLHVSSLLPRDPDGMTLGPIEGFKGSPTQAYGRADWGLMLRGFVDAAYTHNVERRLTEENETLVGAGVGIEASLYRNLFLRVDVGVALTETREVDAGDAEVHIVATFVY